MRAKLVHITDHAYLRWAERVSVTENVFDIHKTIEKSRIIKKCELLPYSLPRLDGSVYSIYNEVMFIMEPISIDEYRLITVVAKFSSGIRFPQKISYEIKNEMKLKKKLKKKQFLQEIREKKQEREEYERSPRIRSKTRSVHVQPIIAGFTNMAPKRDEDLQSPIKQDSAA